MKNILILIISLSSAFGLSAQCLYTTTCDNNLTVCDTTANQAELWNAIYWWNNLYQTHDLADTPCDFSSTAVDTCAGTTISAKYLLFLDLNGDDTLETVIKSWDPPAPGTVNYNNYNNPNFDGGEPRSFDGRPVATDQKYQFAIAVNVVGNSLTASIRWNTTANPGVFTVPELPYGKHKIQWLFEDNLANETVCVQNFVTKDCKEPTIVCLNGLSINIMPTGLIQLWASDFLQYTVDNNTSTNLIEIGIRSSGTGTGFPVDAQGNAINSLSFACSDIGTNNIELWARDLEGNADFCQTILNVQDAQGYCNVATAVNQTICIKRWCDAAVVTGVSLNLGGGANPNSLNQDGCLQFDSLWLLSGSSGIIIQPTKDDGAQNGVTPLDLVKIARHILGLQPMTSPYAMIAADANKSNTITTFDIVENRKLIQGIYTELPNNTSWRFVSADFNFPNPNNPFQTSFPENVTVSNSALGSPTLTEFVAIKIGDIDCDATPGAAAPTDDRQVQFLTMPDATLSAGETVEIPVSFEEAGAWLAMQVGLLYDPAQLEIEAIVPGNLAGLEKSSFAEPSPGVLNLVWYTAEAQGVTANEKFFTLHLRARQALQLSQVLQLTHRTPETPRHLQAEGYDAHESPVNIALAFRGNTSAGPSNQTVVFEVQPNPTADAASIPIKLAQTEMVTITLRDVAGKLIWNQAVTLSAGMQIMEIPATVLRKSGVYFWQIQAGERVASGKLVRI